MKLFASLRKIREIEKVQLSFLKSLIDFDIIIEIGYAEEREKPLTLKQLFLTDIGSRTTVRRRLAKLIEQGVVSRQKHASDKRPALLKISSTALKQFTKYSGALTAIFGSDLA